MRAAPSPLTAPLTELLLRSFGPKQVIAEELTSVTGIDGLYLFGSWAARYHGTEGPAPNDIDVLVIVNPTATCSTTPPTEPNDASPDP